MGTLGQDIRFACRLLRRSPGFALAVILILALGIGANTAIFSLVNAVLLRSFPYEAPNRIVTLREQTHGQNFATMRSVLMYWRDHSQVFAHIAGVRTRGVSVTSTERSPEVWARVVSPSYFSVMGTKPLLGRGFLPGEELPGHESVVVLSFAFWHEHMGGDPQTIGRSLILDGQAHTVVGIMPAAFRDSLRRCAPFWVPLILDPENRDSGTWVSVRARLKPGVTLAQAQAAMDVLEEQLAQADPEHRAGYSVTVDRFLDSQIAGSRSTLYLLWGAIGLVLLIACTNASGLFLVHSNGRRQEIAVRAALGASRSQLMRHMLIEGVILGVAAGAIGILLAYWAIRLLIRVSPINMPRMEETHIDVPVLCFALGVSVITGLLLSLLPAWRATSLRLSDALKQGQGGLLKTRRRLHGGLVVAQIGAASTLLMAVAMLTQSFISLQKTDLGFQPANVLVARINLPGVRYPDRDHWLSFYQHLLPRVEALPGVQSAAAVSEGLDLGSGGTYGRFAIDGRPLFQQGTRPMARLMPVSRDFLKTMGMPILRGGAFTDGATQGEVGGCVIDENLARKYFPDEDPIGQRVSGIPIDGIPIVGVTSTLRDYDSLAPTINTILIPLAVYPCQSSDVVVSCQGDPMTLADVLKAQVAALDKDLELTDVHTLKSYLAEMLAPERYTAILLGLFAQVALILAAVGLFALLQYAVAQRTHEIGIRMALGATQTTITKAFLRQAVTLALLGIGAGLLGGYIASRFMTSLLYDARRAARIDPMQALRHE